MVLHLEGNSVIPQVKLAQSSFAFGAVTVGSCHRLPMTLKVTQTHSSIHQIHLWSWFSTILSRDSPLTPLFLVSHLSTPSLITLVPHPLLTTLFITFFLLSFQNESAIAMEMTLDLSDYPDFTPLITAPTSTGASDMVFDVPSAQEDEYGNTIELLNASPRGEGDGNTAGGKDKNNQANTAKASSNTTNTQPFGGTNRRVPSQKQSSKKEKIYHFFLPVGATLFGALLYKPSKVASLDFQLPFRLKGMSSIELSYVFC